VNFPFLTPILSRFARVRLRRRMRGYRRLKAENRLSCIVELKDALANNRFPLMSQQVSSRIFGAGRKDAEVIIRQYLLVRLGGLNLNKSLLVSLGGGRAVVHPLPDSWRRIVREHGFEVNEVACAVCWYAYICFFATYGVWLMLVECIATLVASVERRTSKIGRFVYFDSLSRGNLPQIDKAKKNCDILSWYLQWPGRAKDLDAIAHGLKNEPVNTFLGVQVVPMQNPTLPLELGDFVRRFLPWCIFSVSFTLLDFLRGRWWHALLLSEAVKAAHTRLVKPGCLARDYLFHNSGWIYRPLWTYDAELRGSRILFYFYSTNIESFKTPLGYPTQANCWQAMNWPHYLVWDEHQAEFVRRSVGVSARLEIVGSIWFHNSPTEIKCIPLWSIAVFDVQPFRSVHYQTLGLPTEYYTPETAKRFLGDIYHCARYFKAKVVFKRKRKINRLAHPSYRRFVEGLTDSQDFIEICSDTAALRVIENCMIVISMPFTSTALIARELGKPSCYYDPDGVLQKDDRAAHGIEVITGREELAKWLFSIARKV